MYAKGFALSITGAISLDVRRGARYFLRKRRSGRCIIRVNECRSHSAWASEYRALVGHTPARAVGRCAAARSQRFRQGRVYPLPAGPLARRFRGAKPADYPSFASGFGAAAGHGLDTRGSSPCRPPGTRSTCKRIVGFLLRGRLAMRGAASVVHGQEQICDSEQFLPFFYF
jgi:hypothetical protein